MWIVYLKVCVANLNINFNLINKFVKFAEQTLQTLQTLRKRWENLTNLVKKNNIKNNDREEYDDIIKTKRGRRIVKGNDNINNKIQVNRQ